MKIHYIHRQIEPMVKKIVNQFPATVITGPRQSGKSTLLKYLFSKTYQYITFDDPLTRERAINDPELFLEELPKKTIIDEIQHVPQILPYIKIIIDENRGKKGQFIFTGSQRFGMMKNLTETLAGRIAIIELLPFSIKEKKTAYKKNTKKYSSTQHYFIDACLHGSFPEIVVDRKIDLNYWYASYIQTYLERDIKTIYNIGSLREFSRFMQLLAARCSQILNLSSLATDIGVSVNTIKQWISVLEASRIIYLLNPYYNNLGKRVTKSPKIYFLDTGLLCFFLSIKNSEYLLHGPMAGAIFENFLVQETIKTLLYNNQRPNIYYIRTSNGIEVDLIIEKNHQLFPFEIKLSKTPRISMTKPIEKFSNIFSRLPIQKGNIISLSEKTSSLSRMTSVIPLSKYLKWIEN